MKFIAPPSNASSLRKKNLARSKVQRTKAQNPALHAHRYRSLFENAMEGFYINTPSGKFEEVNPSFARMLGYDSPKQMIREVTDVASQIYVHPAQRKIFQDLLKKNGYVKKVEFKAKKRDGGVIWLSVCARTVRDEGGSILYYEGYAEDITKRKKFEKELGEMQSSLEEQMRKLDRTNADLERVANAISSDLKVPLHNISSHLSCMLSDQDGLSLESKENISVALDGAKKMKALMDGLVAYSDLRVEDSMKQTVVLQALVEKVILRLKPQIQACRAQIKVSALPKVKGVSDELERVFEELLKNALKFCRKGAICQIGIRAVPKANYWLLEVQDTGRGIDEKYKNVLFNIFHRGTNQSGTNQSYSAELGSGMGLALCRKIVELHGGRIWYNSVVGKGSTFVFSLPA